MSAEKEGTEVHHGISANDHLDHHDIQYPVVAEGTGKTLDEAHGAKAKEVHNVSTSLSILSARHFIIPCNTNNSVFVVFNRIGSYQLTRIEPIGRVFRRCSGVQN